MTAFLLAGLSAFWLGLLTSISPCPMATNLTAVAYIGGQVGKGRAALIAGGAYVLGRALAYAAVGAIVVIGLLSVPAVANFFSQYMNLVLGPLLILVGMLLLGLLSFNLSTSVGGIGLREKAAKAGPLGALFLGVIFALSFCPISAALFFGSLVPLAVEQGSRVTLPLVYGVATGIPVLVLAVLIAMGSGALGSALDKMATFERWARRVTGGVFIVVGLYLTIRFVFLA